MADAIVLHVRGDWRIRSRSRLIATCVNEPGVREILGIKWLIASQQSVGEAQLMQETGRGEGAVAGAIGGSSVGTVVVWFARTVAGAVVFGVIGALS